jgi:hypothetical protein
LVFGGGVVMVFGFVFRWFWVGFLALFRLVGWLALGLFLVAVFGL